MSRLEKRRMIAAAVLVLVIIGTAATAAGCGDQANAGNGPVKLTEADNGKTITVKKGSDIQIALEGNVTTGYAWTAKVGDEAVVQQQGDPVYAPETNDPNVAGAGGTFTFTFKTATAGETTITCEYARPFEQGVAPIQTYSVTITVE